MSNTDINEINKQIKIYEKVTEAMINRDKLIGLLFSEGYFSYHAFHRVFQASRCLVLTPHQEGDEVVGCSI